jgi:SAM-dependent methyltransferase
MRRLAAMALLLSLVCTAVPSAQSPVTPPPLSADQEKRLGALAPDEQVYERFRYWAGLQPPDVQDHARRFYDQYLASRGVPADDRARALATIERAGRRLEAERWNRILTAEKPLFNTSPNAFLVEMVKGRTPGTALDVGMGQGRNAIFLAEQGWRVTGFDPADKAVALANTIARQRGVTLTTHVEGSETFDFGENRWDLILLSYVGARDVADRVVRALRPGGIVVVEAFHRDVTRNNSVGGGVVFDSNELLQLFPGLRVLRYEDLETKTDFGRGLTRAVRLCAMKE